MQVRAYQHIVSSSHSTACLQENAKAYIALSTPYIFPSTSSLFLKNSKHLLKLPFPRHWLESSTQLPSLPLQGNPNHQTNSTSELKSCLADPCLVLIQKKTFFFRQQRSFPFRKFWPRILSKRLAVGTVPTARARARQGRTGAFHCPLRGARPVPSAGNPAEPNALSRARPAAARPPSGTAACAHAHRALRAPRAVPGHGGHGGRAGTRARPRRRHGRGNCPGWAALPRGNLAGLGAARRRAQGRERGFLSAARPSLP